MKTATLFRSSRLLIRRRPRVAFTFLFASAAALLLFAAPALAGDVYSNIGPAPQLPAGGLVGRYPLANYSLDQYFPAISVGLTSGVDASGVAPMMAYFAAQVIWLLTAFLANAVITLFGFAFSLDLRQRERQPRVGCADADLRCDSQPLREYVRCAVADRRGRARGVLGDVEGARATPLHRDRRGARRLASVLRVGDRDRHAARTDDRAGQQALKPALHRAAVAHQPGQHRQ